MVWKFASKIRWLIPIIAIVVIFSMKEIFFNDKKFDPSGFSSFNKESFVVMHPAVTSISTSNNVNIHVAVVLSLSKQTPHISEFYLLYNSWCFLQNFSPLIQEVIVDLIVFCEQPSCFQLPPACLPLSYNKNLDKVSRCFYEELSPTIVKEWQQYLYMTSIAFMLTKEYEVATSKYQWILRVDQDAVLSPGLLYGLREKHSIKLYEMQFGAIGHGIEFTHQRLRDIAKKLGYNHGDIHNLCSGWLVSPQDSIKLANLTTRIGKHLLEQEFGPNVPGIEDLPSIGAWPKWWRGVTSLYAAEIGINHLYFSKLGHQHESHAIDHSADSTASIWQAWHIHCLHNPTEFAKFNHYGRLRDFLGLPQPKRIEIMSNISVTQTILKNVIDEFHNVEDQSGRIDEKTIGKVTVRDYVTALAWQKAYSAVGAINL